MKDSKHLNSQSVNPLYIIINEVDGSIECTSIECNSIEDKSGNKYLAFASINKNKKLLETYTDYRTGLKVLLKK